MVEKKKITSQVYLKTKGHEAPWIPLISIIYPGLNLNNCWWRFETCSSLILIKVRTEDGFN